MSSTERPANEVKKTRREEVGHAVITQSVATRMEAYEHGAETALNDFERTLQGVREALTKKSQPGNSAQQNKDYGEQVRRSAAEARAKLQSMQQTLTRTRQLVDPEQASGKKHEIITALDTKKRTEVLEQLDELEALISEYEKVLQEGTTLPKIKTGLAKMEQRLRSQGLEGFDGLRETTQLVFEEVRDLYRDNREQRDEKLQAEITIIEEQLEQGQQALEAISERFAAQKSMLASDIKALRAAMAGFRNIAFLEHVAQFSLGGVTNATRKDFAIAMSLARSSNIEERGRGREKLRDVEVGTDGVASRNETADKVLETLQKHIASSQNAIKKLEKEKEGLQKESEKLDQAREEESASIRAQIQDLQTAITIGNKGIERIRELADRLDIDRGTTAAVRRGQEDRITEAKQQEKMAQQQAALVEKTKAFTAASTSLGEALAVIRSAAQNDGDIAPAIAAYRTHLADWKGATLQLQHVLREIHIDDTTRRIIGKALQQLASAPADDANFPEKLPFLDVQTALQNVERNLNSAVTDQLHDALGKLDQHIATVRRGKSFDRAMTAAAATSDAPNPNSNNSAERKIAKAVQLAELMNTLTAQAHGWRERFLEIAEMDSPEEMTTAHATFISEITLGIANLEKAIQEFYTADSSDPYTGEGDPHFLSATLQQMQALLQSARSLQAAAAEFTNLDQQRVAVHYQQSVADIVQRGFVPAELIGRWETSLHQLEAAETALVRHAGNSSESFPLTTMQDLRTAQGACDEIISEIKAAAANNDHICEMNAALLNSQEINLPGVEGISVTFNTSKKEYEYTDNVRQALGLPALTCSFGDNGILHTIADGDEEPGVLENWHLNCVTQSELYATHQTQITEMCEKFGLTLEERQGELEYMVANPVDGLVIFVCGCFENKEPTSEQTLRTRMKESQTRGVHQRLSKESTTAHLMQVLRKQPDLAHNFKPWGTQMDTLVSYFLELSEHRSPVSAEDRAVLEALVTHPLIDRDDWNPLIEAGLGDAPVNLLLADLVQTSALPEGVIQSRDIISALQGKNIDEIQTYLRSIHDQELTMLALIIVMSIFSTDLDPKDQKVAMGELFPFIINATESMKIIGREGVSLFLYAIVTAYGEAQTIPTEGRDLVQAILNHKSLELERLRDQLAQVSEDSELHRWISSEIHRREGAVASGVRVLGPREPTLDTTPVAPPVVGVEDEEAAPDLSWLRRASANASADNEGDTDEPVPADTEVQSEAPGFAHIPAQSFVLGQRVNLDLAAFFPDQEVSAWRISQVGGLEGQVPPGLHGLSFDETTGKMSGSVPYWAPPVIVELHIAADTQDGTVTTEFTCEIFNPNNLLSYISEENTAARDKIARDVMQADIQSAIISKDDGEYDLTRKYPEIMVGNELSEDGASLAREVFEIVLHNIDNQIDAPADRKLPRSFTENLYDTAVKFVNDLNRDLQAGDALPIQTLGELVAEILGYLEYKLTPAEDDGAAESEA